MSDWLWMATFAVGAAVIAGTLLWDFITALSEDVDDEPEDKPCLCCGTQMDALSHGEWECPACGHLAIYDRHETPTEAPPKH